MGKAKVKGKSIGVQLTPMVKFYMGVAVVVVFMAAILVLAVLPMFKSEQALEREYRNRVSEYEDILELFEGRTPEETIAEKETVISTFNQEMERLANVFPKAPEIPATDPGIFVVEAYYDKVLEFTGMMEKAGLASDESDFIQEPSSGTPDAPIDVPMEIHKMGSVLAIADIAIKARVSSVGEFNVVELKEDDMGEDPNMVVVPLNFNATCTNRALSSLLYGLDHSTSFFFNITQISISAPAESKVSSPEGPLLSVSVSLQAPYLKPVSAEASSEDGEESGDVASDEGSDKDRSDREKSDDEKPSKGKSGKGKSDKGTSDEDEGKPRSRGSDDDE